MGCVRKEFGLVVLVMAISLMGLLCQCQGRGYDEPLNCKHLECPPYQVIDSHKDYEIRSYSNVVWMSTPLINSNSFKDGTNKGFNMLFAYINGNNRQLAKIDMTAPVLVDINQPTNGPSSNSSFVMHFYLPQKYQNSPPLSDQVLPVSLPKHKYAAVRRFGGFMDNSNIAPEVMALKQSLKGTPWERAVVHAHTDDGNNDTPLVPCSVAGYNSPFEHENRVNEVLIWFD